jgi:hypothetical protein
VFLQSNSNPTDDSTATNTGEMEGGGRGEVQPSDSAAASELSEDQALALLQRPDVTAAELALLGRNPSVIKSRKVLLGLATHPSTPRHITIPLLRRLFTFDLMQVALTPTVAADVKRAAEEQLLHRLESLSLGERISLARRASGRVAGALLLDSDPRVMSAALDNSRLVEASVVTTLMKHGAPESLFALTSDHPKWSLRTDVQIALLRNESLPLDRAVELAGNFSVDVLREIVPESRREILIQPASPSNSKDQESEDQESEEQKAEDQEFEDRQSEESGDEI